MEPQKISKPSATVIDIRQRNITMLKKDLILRNPLMFVGDATDDILPEGGLGANPCPGRYRKDGAACAACPECHAQK